MLRIDGRVKLRWEKTPTGIYRLFAAFGEAGRELKYLQFDTKSGTKQRIEYITEEELFHPDSLETAYGLPVLLKHPTSGMFENNKEGLLVGSTLQEFIREDNTLLIPIALQDGRATRVLSKAIERKEHLEVSPGYWIQEARLMPDGRYEQIGRRYDHLAAPLQPGEGRGGFAIRLRIDSTDVCVSEDFEMEQVEAEEKTEQGAIQYGNNADKTIVSFAKSRQDNKKRMKTLVLDSVGYEIEDEDLFTATVALKQRADSQAVELATVKTENTNLQARIDALTKENADLKGEVSGYKVKVEAWEKSSAGTGDALAKLSEGIALDRKDSIETWMLALPQLRQDNAKYEPDYSLSPTEIKALYLVSKHPDLKTDVADADLSTDTGKRYIDSLWKVLKPQLSEGDASNTLRERQDAFSRIDRQLSFLNSAVPTHTDTGRKKEDARTRFQKKVENNWKGGNGDDDDMKNGRSA
ncbi:MAG: DUF2213 domain-containing protein [Iphinoe sp. HA4291-MV1]|jgi:hypothetical protein|nr:DUF2213 domain-containing protein [Iphinoe sp. HA4291-MV1]